MSMRSALNGYDYLLTIMSDDRDIIFYVWITIEKLAASAKNEESSCGEDDDCDCKSNP
jgi:hypothetical protein